MDEITFESFGTEDNILLDGAFVEVSKDPLFLQEGDAGDDILAALMNDETKNCSKANKIQRKRETKNQFVYDCRL